MLRQPDICTGLVLSSPALHVHIDFVQRCASACTSTTHHHRAQHSIQVGICRIFAKLAPSQRLAPSIDTSWISDDPADVQRYEEDVLIDKGKLRAVTAITFLVCVITQTAIHAFHYTQQ